MTSRFGALVALLVLSGGCANEAKSPSAAGGGGDHAGIGAAAPELAVETLNDKGKVSLKELEGKVVIVDFWATWCGPCKQSFPKLEELSKKVGDKVVVVGISCDDEKKGVAEFAKENGATFPIAWDENHKIAKSWKVSATMPTTFIVDPTGKIRHIHDGYRDGETQAMEKEATALLAEGTGDTKVAKNDAKADDAKGDKSADAKSDGKSDSKGDTKTDAKADAAKTDEKADEPEDPPAGTKKKPPAKKKKPGKKKKPAG